MTYAVKQDLLDRFGAQQLIDLTDDADPPVGAINDTVVNRALADADADINGYLSARYALPLATVPTVLVRLACDLTRYYLFADRVTDQVKQRYQDAMKMLQAIGNGTATLGVDAANQVQPVAEGVSFQSADRVFTRDSIADYEL